MSLMSLGDSNVSSEVSAFRCSSFYDSTIIVTVVFEFLLAMYKGSALFIKKYYPYKNLIL